MRYSLQQRPVEFVVAELAEPANDKAASVGDVGDELPLELEVPGSPPEMITAPGE